VAKDAVAKAGKYAYRGRKEKKRDYRKLWIARINAAVRAEGMNYSQFMHGLALAKIQLNRKAISNMAIEDKQAFTALVAQAKAALES
jgi:large subunit ribosomal protein L20